MAIAVTSTWCLCVICRSSKSVLCCSTGSDSVSHRKRHCDYSGVRLELRQVKVIMPTSTVHVTEDTHRVLQALCQQTVRSMSEILQNAVEEYRRKVFFEGVDRD